MRPHSIPRLAVALLAVVVTAAPALAGGGGGAPTVEADPPPAEARVGEAVRLGFMVTQHGQPVSDMRPHLSALHQETKESFTVDAVRDTDPGRYRVEATFHEAGTWFWEIVLESFGATTLPPLTVLAADAPRGAGSLAAAFEPEVALPAAVHRGTCAAAGEVAYPLPSLRFGAVEVLGSRAAAPVKQSATVIAAPLDGLLGAEHAVAVAFDDGSGSTPLACGEVGGPLTGDTLALGLRPVGDSPFAGVAVLARQGERTEVTTYLTLVSPTAGAAPAGPAESAAIALFAFDPPRLTVAAGTTVTWTNRDTVPHTVAFDDMALADSPPLELDDTFSVTFATPGTYAYHCGPHPSMVGTVVVE
jgi:amicyanin